MPESVAVRGRARFVDATTLELEDGQRVNARGRALLQWAGVSSGEKTFDRVLLATGRPPNLQALNLELLEQPFYHPTLEEGLLPARDLWTC